MAGWLTRTTSLFRQPIPAPEPYEVECDCGGKLVGQRTTSYQKPLCPVCDRPVFILPANVYPRPKIKPAKDKPQVGAAGKPSSGGKPLKSSPNSVVDDNPSSSPLRPGSGKKTPGTRDSAPAVGSQPTLLQAPPRPFFTPLRLITGSILIISVLTGGGLWYRQQWETAKATVSSATDAGRAALRDRDYVTAAKELERAKAAVDLLERKDRTAEDIRRQSREATVLANLAANSLSEILEDTLANAKPGNTDPLRMASLDQNAWVIFDTSLIPFPTGSNRFQVDAPLWSTRHQVYIQLEIESPALAKVAIADEGAEAPRVIFAAQLEEMSAPTGKPATSILKLNGKTAILWTDYETYQAVGFNPHGDTEYEQQTKAILAKQLELQ